MKKCEFQRCFQYIIYSSKIILKTASNNNSFYNFVALKIRY